MARIDDLGDKLRLGMNKLQAAVGETARGGPDGGEVSILSVYFQLFVYFLLYHQSCPFRWRRRRRCGRRRWRASGRGSPRPWPSSTTRSES